MKSVFALLAATCIALPAAGQAQEFPTRPVRIISPFPPGGFNDILSRLTAQKLTEFWSQQVVVENRPGSAGNIGAGIAARATPDGYTLMLGTNTHAVNATLYRKLQYDFARDFAPVGMLSAFPYLLLVHPSLPVSDVPALVGLARKNPGELLHSSSGNGSTPHLAAEVFKLAAEIKMVHVPYKGASEALTDLVAGRMQVGFASISSALPLVRTGRLRALAVTSAERTAAVAELPTLRELGYRDVEVTTWNALFAPAKTPPAVIKRLSTDLMQAVSDPEVRSRLAGVGVEAVGSTPAQLEAFVRDEMVRWGRVVKTSGATID